MGTRDTSTRGLRALPSVETLRQAVLARRTSLIASSDQLTRAARKVIQQARDEMKAGTANPDLDTLARNVVDALDEAVTARFKPVINATGVVLHTNLGRAPLAADALRYVHAISSGYSNLELDLTSGRRGSRLTGLGPLLSTLTGAEAGLAVNNNAAAMLLVLSELARDGEVIVSRGELVEIGGGFRIPDVLRQSGARLVEVGTTNKTRVADYRDAITPETKVLLAVHPSNFRVVGFTESPTLAELGALARAHDIKLVYDLGSGSLLDTASLGIEHEPQPQEAIVAGADLVCFSGDKLLGGPQAGIIVGKGELISRLKRHPLMRALRLDKMSLAALEATLRLWERKEFDSIPIVGMLRIPAEELASRAQRWVAQLHDCGISATTQPATSPTGGGSLPGTGLPTTVCVIDCALNVRQAAQQTNSSEDVAAAVAQALRLRNPAVLARVNRGQLLLDPRTVSLSEEVKLIEALREVFNGRDRA